MRNLMNPVLAATVLALLLPGLARADVQCDGIDDLFTTGLALSVFHTGTTATAMLWVKVGSGGSGEADCWNSPPYVGDNNLIWVLAQPPAGGVCGYMEDAGGGRRIDSAATAGTWTHLAITLSGGLFTFYKDGSAVSTLAAGTLLLTNGPMVVCGHVGEANYVQARVTDIKLYNVAVPAGEIATLGSSRLRHTGRSTPTAHWPLTQCADGSAAQGVAFVDRSGNGRVLTGDDGANNTGLTCRASEFLSGVWGPH